MIVSIFSYLNWIDILILLTLVISGFAGLFRGFVKEVTTFGVWFFSFLGAWLFSASLGAKIQEWMGEARYESWQRKFDNDSYLDFALRFAGGILIFIILLIFLQIVVSVFTARIRFSALSSVDKILGLIIGVIRALVLLSLIWYFASYTMAITQKGEQNQQKSYIQTINNSKLLPIVKLSTVFIKPFLDPLILYFSKSPDINWGDMNTDSSFKIEDLQTPQNDDSGGLLINENTDTPLLTDNMIDTTDEPEIGNAEDATERAITPIIGQDAPVDELPEGANLEIDNILSQ